MPKIIFSNYDDTKNPYYGGGGAVAIHEIARRLAKDLEVTVVTGKYPGSKDEILDGVRYERVGTNLLGPKMGQLIFAFILPFYAWRKKFDIWVESLTPPFSFSFLPLLTRRPVVGLAHTLAGQDAARKYNLPFHLIEKRGLRSYRQFIAVSEYVRRQILIAHPKAEVTVIPNGIELPKLGDQAPGEYILFLGRIEIDQKGLDLLLKAYRQIKGKTSLPLYIAGGGSAREQDRLKELVSDLGLIDDVLLLGRAEEQKKMRLYGRAAFSVVPSRFETFSMAALESLAFGKPVIAFDIPGLSWLPESAAAKVEPLDPEALGEAMLRLSQDAGLRTEMGERGRKLAAQYTWEAAAGKYKALILSAVPESLAGPGHGAIDAKAMMENIISRKLPCYFISPHLDDAALSAGNLISFLAKETEVTIVTVFTKADAAGPETFSAKRYLKQCGFRSAEKLYRQRRKEDWIACGLLGAKAVHLGFVEGLWRKRGRPGRLALAVGRLFPEALHLYPTYRWHMLAGHWHEQDGLLRRRIVKALDRLIPQQQAAVFCPAGFGCHVDHLLVRSASEQLFPQTILWQDLPYASSLENDEPVAGKTEAVWPGNLQNKQSVLTSYRTQFPALYPSGRIPAGEERFYI